MLHIEELLDEEVTALAGERYARKDPSVGGRRHGSNPGSNGSKKASRTTQWTRLSCHRFRANEVRLDGKTFAEATMVVALGITMTGDKRFLGFVETDTENEQVLTPFLRSLVERGLDVSQGPFLMPSMVQRCQWHKRENVVSCLAKREQPVWRQRLQRAYNRPEYDEALAALQSLQHELEDRNQSAAGSLAEGLDETLTLHRLGVYGVLGRSLKTTNGLESINALIEERCAKVDHWQNSSQRQRWLATALLDIEPRLRKVMGYRHLPRLRDALKRELKIDTTTSKTKAA